MSRTWHILLMMLFLSAMLGCEGTYDATSDDDPSDSSSSDSSGSDSSPTSEPSGTSDPQFDGVHFLHADVSTWKQTAKLNASVRGDRVILDYNKAKVWPAVEGVNASAWVLFTFNGQKYAATFDYLRPGQTSKGADFYIPVGGTRWRPSSGERVGFMVSGLARDHRRNVYERSNVDNVTWP